MLTSWGDDPPHVHRRYVLAGTLCSKVPGRQCRTRHVPYYCRHGRSHLRDGWSSRLRLRRPGGGIQHGKRPARAADRAARTVAGAGRLPRYQRANELRAYRAHERAGQDRRPPRRDDSARGQHPGRRAVDRAGVLAPENRAVLHSIQEMYASGAQLAAACTGPFSWPRPASWTIRRPRPAGGWGRLSGVDIRGSGWTRA